MVVDDIIDPNELVVGDVVQDKATHKPLQILGRERRRAVDLDTVMGSLVNRAVFDVDPDDKLYRCVFLPKGERLHVPNEIHHFPADRLERVRTEYPSDDARPQAVVARAVMANLLAEMRNRGEKDAAAVLEQVICDELPDEYAGSTIELSDVVRQERSQND